MMMVNAAPPITLTFKSSPEPLLSFMVHNVDDLIQCSKERRYYQHMLLPELPKFIKVIYQKCRLSPTVLVISLIYLERLKKNLPEKAQGEYDTPYKLFLAAIIVATKYIEDYKSHASSIYKIVSPLYSPKELNEMERSFLGVLKFDLFVNLSEMDRFVDQHQESLELELFSMA
ncbi:cyclin domain-containing protein [Blakeslea trispora]|nr:cyclin domain-containing protein [Blakeslea trispora]